MEDWFVQFICFSVGTLIGSFLNVVIRRMPRGESIVSPPSHCPSCGFRLQWRDLIPLFSYLLLLGRCRNCGSSIGIRYPLIELVNGLGYLGIFLHRGFSLSSLSLMVLFSILLAVVFIDLDSMIIPDNLMLFGLLTGILLTASQTWSVFVEGIIGMVIGGGILLTIAVLSKGGMGGGDIKLAGVLGLFLGSHQILLILFLSFLMGSVVGITLMIMKRKTMKDMIPFGPFLAMAAYISMFWGNSILYWYGLMYY
ncbi:prepilin peptidase [Heliobacillus mobilis]|uniref:Prepilin leader peptidase/N-methyltransferase n=1 Tax=Heliobacterium mobile TaxID=28064 RepID=A0A6I3SL31_HELMO|nr:A24 family peptidase [Heliobacterium mobile]MTV49392.1 prepilin peptidase [Heliobacterium mobile]